MCSFKIRKYCKYSGSKPWKFSIRVRVFQWVIQAITIPVKPIFSQAPRLFNDQVQGIFSKNVITLKIHIILFQLKAFQLKEKISFLS